VQDFPVAESLMTSMSIGMCLNQINKVVLVHHRIDFMLYSMDAIVNWMSLWKFKSYKDTPYPNNPEIELLLNNIKQKLPSIIKTGFAKPDFIFNVPAVGQQPMFGKQLGVYGGYKSSRKNKKYRKPRKYIYR
jgi:hypothetical protein